jgi:hypothetical protein
MFKFPQIKQGADCGFGKSAPIEETEAAESMDWRKSYGSVGVRRHVG